MWFGQALRFCFWFIFLLRSLGQLTLKFYDNRTALGSLPMTMDAECLTVCQKIYIYILYNTYILEIKAGKV